MTTTSVWAASFHAMNTEITVLTPAGTPESERALETVQTVFEEVENRLSRFRPDSELSALNRSSGKPFKASPGLFRAVSLALEAAESTNGVFDPTVLPALQAAGYDRSFELIGSHSATTVVATLPNYRGVRRDPSLSIVTLPAGCQLDLGGIGKGLAVDLAIEATEFLGDRCINAGGDIAARGHSANNKGWIVALEDGDANAFPVVEVCDGALATSTTTKRRWSSGERTVHHLIDPHTGLPSTSPFRTVTVVAATCVQADVAAKTALLMGEPGLDFVANLGMHAFAVRQDGTTTHTAGWPA